MNRQIRKALDAAHAPAARKKAVATMVSLAHSRARLAKKYNQPPRAFTKSKLLHTIKLLDIPIASIPAILFKPFPKWQQKQLLGKKGNGHDTSGTSIPLDAIPAKESDTKREARLAAQRDGYHRNKGKGHPNGALIDKVLDMIGRPNVSDKVAQRLLAVLEKLIGDQ